MTNLTEMWVEIAKHQPIADKLGYGQKWKRMCKQKTEMSADAVARAAAGDAREAAHFTAWAVRGAKKAAEETKLAVSAASYAIEYMKKANGIEQ